MSFSYAHTTHNHNRSRNNSESEDGGKRSRHNSHNEEHGKNRSRHNSHNEDHVKSGSRKNSHNSEEQGKRSRNNSQNEDHHKSKSRHNSHSDKVGDKPKSRTTSHSSETDCGDLLKPPHIPSTNGTADEQHNTAQHTSVVVSEHVFFEDELRHKMETPEQKVIVLAVDGGAHSELAFKFYKDNVDRPGYYLHVVHHCDVWRHYLPEEGGPSENHYQEIQAKAKGVIDEVEVKYKKMIEEQKINGEVVILHGKDPWHDIVKHQEDSNAIMIVMGTRGGGALARTFRGSVSDSVVHHAKVPVLVCCHPKNI